MSERQHQGRLDHMRCTHTENKPPLPALVGVHVVASLLGHTRLEWSGPTILMLHRLKRL